SGASGRGQEKIERGAVCRHPRAEGVQEPTRQAPRQWSGEDPNGGGRIRSLDRRSEARPESESRRQENQDEGEVCEGPEASAERGPEEELQLVREEGERPTEGLSSLETAGSAGRFDGGCDGLLGEPEQ